MHSIVPFQNTLPLTMNTIVEDLHEKTTIVIMHIEI
jgi:hypothetical protein